jgi:small subunit ribosomal protein S15
MYNSKEVTESIFKKHGKSEKDTGSPEGQIALLPTEFNIYRII